MSLSRDKKNLGTREVLLDRRHDCQNSRKSGTLGFNYANPPGKKYLAVGISCIRQSYSVNATTQIDLNVPMNYIWVVVEQNNSGDYSRPPSN